MGCSDGCIYFHSGWGECTAEQVTDGTRNPLWIYLASKILAEKEAWKFAQENNVLMTDEYDNINEDLAPFWDITGEQLRWRAAIVCVP